MKKGSIPFGFLALAMIAPMAVAQEDGMVLEEIIVTAQRREQSLQEVPVAVTAFTGEALEIANITEAAQYLNLTPNVSYTEDGQVGSRGISIAMRGVSNINTDESSFIQSIGVYLDEFSVASVGQGTVNPQLQDLERLEVLRGPQGTYFGRNAVGGALNLTTRKPQPEFDYSASLGFRNFENAAEQYDFSGMINLPVSDNFMLRGVLYYEDSGGLVENIVPGGGDSGHDYTMLRVSARWLLDDATTVDLMLMNSDENQGHDENVPAGVWDTDSVATFLFRGPSGGLREPVDPGTGFWPENRSKTARSAIGEKNDNSTSIAILKVSREMSDTATLNWISGWIDTELDRVFDNDLVPANVVFRDQTREGTSFSTELRLDITSDAFDWTVGAMYARDEKDMSNAVQSGTTTVVNGVDHALQVPALPPAFLPAVWGWPEGSFFCLACADDGFELTSVAVFTDVTWHMTDRFDFTLGGRYTSDDVTNTYLPYGSSPAGPKNPRWPNNLVPTMEISGEETFTDLSPRVALSYDLTDEATVYATVSRGYKAGGFSLGRNGADNSAINEVFDPEILTNYEVGVKSELFDGRARFNAAAFLLDWEDLQLETFFFLVPGDATTNVELTINVQEARATGLEAELAALVTENLTLTAGLGVIDTEILSDDVARLSGNLFVDLKGQPLPRAPELTWSMAADYAFTLDQLDGWARLEWIYKDSQYSTIEDVTYLQTSGATIYSDPLTQTDWIAQVPSRTDGFPFRTPEVDIFNLRAGVHLNECWEVVAYVENLTDEEYFTGTGENFGFSGFRLRPHPRIWGAKVSYKFGR
ncbi:MAG: TonB-dependent receptor [Gammaproteobacteria bacterium]|nr:TonB-dependent receptor [Gammaproteobacteria bacterium]MDE0414874.1 TonB-dependent receptor [Gammaproteobacteria bacterium]